MADTQRELPEATTILINKKSITLSKLGTATDSYLATYEVQQGGSTVGKIDIPKDYLVKSVDVNVVTVANKPVSGYQVGDKYFDFIINTLDNSGSDEHIYVNVNDLVDIYEADGSSLELYTQNGVKKFRVKSGGITSAHIANGTIVNEDISNSADIAFSKLKVAKSDITGLGIPAQDTTYTPASATPKPDYSVGGSVGTETKYAREDHVHPSYNWTSGGTAGTTGYAKIAQIKINSTYQDNPIELILFNRGRQEPTYCYVKFKNVNNTTPDLDSIKHKGQNQTIYIHKDSDSIWSIIALKSEGYDSYKVIVNNPNAGIAVTQLNEQVTLLTSTSTNPLTASTYIGFTAEEKTKLNGIETEANKITKTSQLTNDGDDGTNVFVKNNDSRLSDVRNPKFNDIAATSSNLKDLDNYTTGGFYYCKSDVNSAPYISNCPLTGSNNKSFFLLVEQWNSSAYIKQTLTYYHNNETYIRTKQASAGWKPWRKTTEVSFSPTKTSGIEIGTLTINGVETKIYQQDNNTTYTLSSLKDSNAHSNIGSNANASQADINTAIDSKISTLATKDEIDSITTGNVTLTGYVKQSDIQNNLTSTDTNKPLSAAQGKLLNTAISTKTVTVEKISTESGYAASYVVKQNGTKVGVTINIPKDFLVKSATLETCATTGTPTGMTKGDKYIDFVVNTIDNSGTATHIYLKVQDLIDVYEADGTSIELYSENGVQKFRVKDNGITTVKIADLNVTTAKIANSAVTSAKIADKTIVNGDIADTTIQGGKLVSGTITATQLASNAVETAKIKDSNITTAKIADSNITTAKIADSNVTTAKIADLNVTTDKIANSAITSAKIADGTIVNDDIADNAIEFTKLKPKTVAANTDFDEIKEVGLHSLSKKTTVTNRPSFLTSLSCTILNFKYTAADDNIHQLVYTINNTITANKIYYRIHSSSGWTDWRQSIFQDEIFHGNVPDTATSFKECTTQGFYLCDTNVGANITDKPFTGNYICLIENKNYSNTIFVQYCYKLPSSETSALEIYFRKSTAADKWTEWEQIARKSDIPSVINNLSSNSTTDALSAAQGKELSIAIGQKTITVDKLTTATSGYAASYVVKQNGTQVGATINIPKDFLVKSASVKSCTTANNPVSGYKVGDKYLDFVVNTDNVDGVADSHLYILVSELVDVYGADGSSVELYTDNGVQKFRVKAGGITATQLASNAVETDKIKDSNVTAAKIADLNVTTGKIANSAVTSAKIADGTIVNADIASNAAIAYSKLSGVAASSHSHTVSDLPTASTDAAGIIQIGTGASNAAAGNHTHTTHSQENITSGTDLNTVTTPGWYHNDSNANVKLMTNTPWTEANDTANSCAFAMIVTATYGCNQILIPYTRTDIYIRKNNDSQLRSNYWQRWQRINTGDGLNGTLGGTTSAFTTTIKGVNLTHGTVIACYNAVGANAANATLDVNGLGAKPIYYNASAIPASRFPNKATCLLMYNTSLVSTGCWQLIYSYDSNSTYTAASATPTADTASGAVGTSAKYAREDHVHPKSSIYAEASHSHTKSQITDFPTSMTPTSHTHGNITNAGAIGSTANLPIITTTDGKLTTGNFESTATNIKMNGTQAVGSSNNFARADHVHPTDTSRAASSHAHGNITNTGAIGSTANLPVITTTSGKLTTGSFGTAANTFCQGNDSRLSDKRAPINTELGTTSNPIDLDTIVNDGFYFGNRANALTVSNTPDDTYTHRFTLLVESFDQSTNYFKQTLTYFDNRETYVRSKKDSTWNAWKKIYTNGNLTKADITALGIPAQDTVYSHPSYTARTGVPTQDYNLSFGERFNVSQPVSDASGHITAINGRWYTMPTLPTADTSTAGITKLVNDLTTGGTDKALTAEQGKVLNDSITNTKPWVSKIYSSKTWSEGFSDYTNVRIDAGTKLYFGCCNGRDTNNYLVGSVYIDFNNGSDMYKRSLSYGWGEQTINNAGTYIIKAYFVADDANQGVPTGSFVSALSCRVTAV